MIVAHRDVTPIYHLNRTGFFTYDPRSGDEKISMKASRFSDAQIAFMLRQAEDGTDRKIRVLTKSLENSAPTSPNSGSTSIGAPLERANWPKRLAALAQQTWPWTFIAATESSSKEPGSIQFFQYSKENISASSSGNSQL